MEELKKRGYGRRKELGILMKQVWEIRTDFPDLSECMGLFKNLSHAE